MVCVGFLVASGSAHGAGAVFERSAPHANVVSHGTVPPGRGSPGFELHADLRTGDSGSASGGAVFLFADGSVRSFHAVGGRMQNRGISGSIVDLVLLPVLPSGDLDAARPSTAAVMESRWQPGVLHWVIDGGAEERPLRFMAPGEVTPAERPGSPPSPHWFSVSHRPQAVQVQGGGEPVRFDASVRVRRDSSAHGRVEISAAGGGRDAMRLEPFFGTYNEDSGEIVLLLAVQDAALRRENLVVARVMPDPERAARISWDLFGLEEKGGPISVAFEAVGRFEIRDPAPPLEVQPTFSSRTEQRLGEGDPQALTPWNLAYTNDGYWRANRGRTWARLNGWMRRKMAANFLVEGDSIPVAVLFSAEARVDSPGRRMFARILVDGEPMHPGDVVLAVGEPVDRRATQSFEFTGIYDRGLHTLEVEWLMDEGASGFIRDASLLIRQGNSSVARPVLVPVTPESGPNLETESTAWQDVPGLEAWIATRTTRDVLMATVSAEAYASGGSRVEMRVLVDGGVARPGRVRFATGRYEGTRTMLFGVTDLAPGDHHVRVQWRSRGGGRAGMGDRTLTLSVGAQESFAPLRQYARFADDVIHPGGGYAPMPDMEQHTLILPDSDVAVVLTAEIMETPSAPVWARLSVAGVPVPESAVLLANRETSPGVHSYVFDAKHVGAGEVSLLAPIRIEWRAEGVGDGDSNDSRPAIAARSMGILLKEHVAPDLAEPPRIGGGISFDGSTPESMGVEPIHGPRNVLVILWDPDRPGEPAPSLASLTASMFGESNSAGDYFDKVSGGRLTLVNAGVLGPYGSQHPWEHYWENVPGRHQEKWREAVFAASHDISFASFDTDGDGYLSAQDELMVVIVVPQSQGSGFARLLWSDTGPLPVSGVYIEHIVEWYTSDPQAEYVTVCHELGHQLLRLGDLYDKSSAFPSLNTRPGGFCLMDGDALMTPNHLNPAFKLALGWVTPTILRTDGVVSLPEVKTSREVVVLPRSPGRAADEYIVLENRLKLASNDLYDAGLFDSGLGVWHVIESPVDSDHPPVCTPAATWAAQTTGDHGRRAVRLVRPGVSYSGLLGLWTGSDGDLDTTTLVCPDDATAEEPAHNVLLWSTYEGAYEIRNISAAGEVMTFRVVAP